MDKITPVDRDGREALLLHSCCAPCSTYPLQILERDFCVTVFFYNPNIQPQVEYTARRDEIRRFVLGKGIPFLEGPAETTDWYEMVKGYEQEPEGGRRCEICYRMRLEKTAQWAKKEGMHFFTTTLSISPHKKAAVINRIGKELGKVYGLAYYEADFKKKDGFKISCRMSEEEGLYRQDYCGCVYSLRSMVTKRRGHD